MKFSFFVVAVLLAASLGGCGSNSAPEVMPDVSGKRLDIATSDLKGLGVDEDIVEVVGGGAFGVIDESNWTVCDQEPGAGEKLESAIRLVVDRSCGDEDALDSSGDEQTEEAEQRSPQPDSATSDTAETFTMPNLVGENLQDAQDKLQALDSFFLQQNDATGMERFQVIDSNWKVCTQKPSAGQKVPVEKMVVLEAVKLDETCP
jgi:beta-lactam-binding protein with PASTA domain